MPCTVLEPDDTPLEYTQKMLCQACKFLSKEQVLSIKGSDGYIDLYEWYIQHLFSDFNTLKKSSEEKIEKIEKEFDRLSIVRGKNKLGLDYVVIPNR